MSFADWSIAKKVAALLALPVILATVLGGIRVKAELDNAAASSRAEAQAQLLPETTALIDATDQLLARSGDANQRRFDQASSDLRSSVAGADLPESQLNDLNSAIAAAEQLPASVDDPAKVRQALYGITGDVESYVGSIATESDSAESALEAVIAGLRARLDLTEQRIGFAGDVEAVTSAQRDAAIGAAGRESASLASPALAEVSEIRGRLRLLQDANEARQASLSRTSVASAMIANASAGRASRLYAAMGTELSDHAVQTLADETRDRRLNALRDTALILGALLAVFALALLVARMLIRPITRVRRDALDVAHRALPDAVEKIQHGSEPDPLVPVGVHSNEEIGQLARAVDEMHDQARNLAGAQARLRTQVNDMFETLSRRSATLVTQQLGLLEQLERDEEDPARLSRLFQLDHLAARMRRNGQSLLVLAGADGRRAASEDLSLNDVIRAAMSEVPGYERVRAEIPFQADVSGVVAPDLVHLFAELIDNALAYASPSSEVTVAGTRMADGSVRVEIVDRGLGMAADALDEANRGLEAGGDVSASTARRMGLFVVGRLARRYGLTVRLRSNQATGEAGMTAVVQLPPDLGEAPASPRPSVARMTPDPVASSQTEDQTEHTVAIDRIERAGTGGVAPSGLPRRAPVVPGTPQPTTPRVVVPAGAQTGAQSGAQTGALTGAHAGAHSPQATSAQLVPEQTGPEIAVAGAQPASDPEPSTSIPPADPLADLGDSPIFNELQSSWLSDDGKAQRWSNPNIDQGWAAAEEAETAEVGGRTLAGLPVRTPGARLVPGAIEQPAPAAASLRDPERIRRSLTHHLDGVRRGRAAAQTDETNDTRI